MPVRDVVICGGGLAGLLLARQIRRELPQLHVTLIERTRRPLPDAAHKVGESSVELGSQYLERLGLKDYMLERHLVKLGLRFFPGGGHLPLAQRCEIGPCAEPLVRSYQIDRGRFEEDLRAFDEADGVTLVEGARVLDIALGKDGAPHVVSYELDGAAHQLATRWVVDAAGRSALLRRQLKLTRTSPHAASAAWFRIAGRLDISDLVPASEAAWHARPCADVRWRSTNHLMGRGYWAWIIPLATGNTSIGIVVHDTVHDFHEISSLERARDFLARHEPVLATALESAEVLDFLCLKGYSHSISRCWSAERWAIVGEAGAFVDPLYSPGTDFITFANCFTVEMLRVERAGGDLAGKAALLNAQYRVSVGGTIELFRQAAPVYGHSRAMAAKVYWDNFAYWNFTCQYFQQDVYKKSAEEHEPYAEIGRHFLTWTGRVQSLLAGWAELLPEVAPEAIFRPLPVFPSMLVDAHIAAGKQLPAD
ncbi:MAG TPA: tryptophan 7-halogenase, partial [Planctomycetota bacterium]|nr:tryptophan 7-halogenase [Planctomycetota bacterium]